MRGTRNLATFTLIHLQDLFTHPWLAAIGGIAGAAAAAFAAWTSVKLAGSLRKDQAERERIEADVLLRLIVPEVSVFAAMMRMASRNLAVALGERPNAVADRRSLFQMAQGLAVEQHPYLSAAHGRLGILPAPLGSELASTLSGTQTIQRMARMVSEELDRVPDEQIYRATQRLRQLLDELALNHIRTANKCREAVKQPLIPEDGSPMVAA